MILALALMLAAQSNRLAASYSAVCLRLQPFALVRSLAARLHQDLYY